MKTPHTGFIHEGLLKARKAGRRAAAGTVAVSLLIAGLGFGPGTAAAADVPNCVQTFLHDEGWRDDLMVVNRCKTLQRVKVVVANEQDKACQSFEPGDSYEYSWGYPGRFDKLVPC